MQNRSNENRRNDRRVAKPLFFPTFANFIYVAPTLLIPLYVKDNGQLVKPSSA